MYRLYSVCQSGNSFKVAFLLRALHQPFETVFVDFMHGQSRDPSWRQGTNEMGEVPVLEHRGRRISQSGVILHYLADHFGKFQGEDRQEVLRWILWDNHKLTSYIATLRWMITLAKTGEPAVHEFLRGRIKTSLGILDLHLQKLPFAAGEAPTIADLSMCGYLYWPDEFGVSWSDYPRIGAWLERIKALPGWVHPYELMPGHPLKR